MSANDEIEPTKLEALIKSYSKRFDTEEVDAFLEKAQNAKAILELANKETLKTGGVAKLKELAKEFGLPTDGKTEQLQELVKDQFNADSKNTLKKLDKVIKKAEERKADLAGRKSGASKSNSSAEEKSSTKKSAKKSASSGSTEEKSRTKKTVTGKKGGAPKAPAGSSKSADVKGKFADTGDKFTFSKEPGLNYREGQGKIDVDGPHDVYERNKKAARKNDLIDWYKYKKMADYKKVFASNDALISGIMTTAVKLSHGFGKYGNAARFQARAKKFESSELLSTKDYAIVDLKKVDRMIEFANIRLACYRRWLQAKSIRAGKAAPPTKFTQANARYILTEEAKNWLKAESFPVPKDVTVKDSKGKSHDDLQTFFKAETGKAWRDSHLLTDGYSTKGALNLLIHLTIAQHKADLRKPDIKALKKIGRKKAPKYDWSEAMTANLGEGTKATWARVLEDGKMVRVTNKDAKKSVIELVAEATEARIKSNPETKKKPGKAGKGDDEDSTYKVKDSPLYATTDHLWMTNVAVLEEYLHGKAPELTNTFLTTKYDDADAKLTAIFNEVLAEYNTIHRFNIAIHNSEYENKKNSKKGKKGKSGRKAI